MEQITLSLPPPGLTVLRRTVSRRLFAITNGDADPISTDEAPILQDLHQILVNSDPDTVKSERRQLELESLSESAPSDLH